MMPWRLFSLPFFFAFLLSPPLGLKKAQALPLDGRLGLGGEISSFAPAISAKYWVSNLGIQGLFSMDLNNPSSASRVSQDYRIGGRLLYAAARTRTVHLNAAVGIWGELHEGKNADDHKLWIELLLSPEFFFNKHLSVSALFSYRIELGSRLHFTTDAFSWGGGFHFYF